MGELEELRERVRELERENAALATAQARYDALAEHSNAGIWQIRPDGQTLFANPAICRMLEIDGPHALEGRSAFEFFTEESLPTMSREHGRRVEGVASSYEAELVGARGGRRRVIIAGAPLRSADGELLSLIATFTDITRERRAIEELRQACARLDLAQESAQMALFEWDIEADRVASWFAGRTLSTPGTLHDALAQSIAPDHRDRVRRALQDAIDDPHRERIELEYQAVYTDGSVRWRTAKIRVFRDENGRASKLVGASVDVTEKKELELRLAAAERLDSLGRLAGGIAHDFNNLLTVILSTVVLVRDGRVPAAQGLDDLQDAAERAARLTRRLLAFARRQSMERVPLDLAALVSRTCGLLDRALGEDIEVVLSVPPDLAVVLADPAQIEQVIINLATNARDAMPSGGRLSIEVERADRQILMRFTDTGVGMDERTREHAFEPFFSTKSSGSGLGLATTYGIVTQLGGRIVMRSEPGRGTTVEVHLPATDLPLAPHAAVPSASGAPAGETVLVVDDEPAVRRVLCQCLAAEGYQVRVAEGSDDALDRLEEGVDLLLTDVRMPGTSGYELSKLVRAQRPAMPILFVSGYAEDEHTGEPRTAFLAKPFELSLLLRAVRRLLDERP